VSKQFEILMEQKTPLAGNGAKKKLIYFEQQTLMI